MPPPRRRRLALALLLAVAASLLLASGALGDAFTPESGGSPNADQIDSLYKIILYIALVIFVIVEGVLLYSLIRFRVRKGRGKGRVAAQIHGNTRLELSWTAAAGLILVALTVVTFVKLGSIENPPNSGPDGLASTSHGVLTASTTAPSPPNGRKLNVCVSGRQFIWRFTYTSDCKDAFGKVYSYEEMVVPAQTTVVLTIESTDVDHSWWVPKLGGKFDAIPGYTNYTWFKAPKPGITYRGQCAELCGRNHANMTARVRVVTAAQYKAWLKRQAAYIKRANTLVQGQRKQMQRAGEL